MEACGVKFAVTVGFMVDGSFSLGCTIQRQSGLGYFLYLMSQDVSSLSGKPCIKHGTGRKRLHQHHSYAQLLVRLWSSNPGARSVAAGSGPVWSESTCALSRSEAVGRDRRPSGWMRFAQADCGGLWVGAFSQGVLAGPAGSLSV